MIHFLRNRLSLFTLLLIASTASVYAQPELTIQRRVIDWPNVTLYTTVKCDGTVQYSLDKSFYTLTENGETVYDWDVTTKWRYPHSTALASLVFDVGDDTSRYWFDAQTEGGLAYVNRMYAGYGEASIIAYAYNAVVELGGTNSKNDLTTAIQSLTSKGPRALWEGLYVGLQELPDPYTHTCNAVIAFVEGQSTAGTVTRSQVEEYALAHRLRIYTIGTPAAPHTQLDDLAKATGGRHYVVSDPSEVVPIYKELADLLAGGFNEVVLSYEARCADGTQRNVGVEFHDYCSSAASVTTSYTAETGGGTGSVLRFGCGDASGEAGKYVEVPILLQAGAGPSTLLNKMYLRIGYDPQCMLFDRITTSAETILYPSAIKVLGDPEPGAVDMLTRSIVSVDGKNTLAYARFRLLKNPETTTVCHLWVEEAAFTNGCDTTEIGSEGDITITHTDDVFIVPESITICPGDTAVLIAPEGFEKYLWTNGDTTRIIKVTTADQYQVAVLTKLGQWISSGISVVSKDDGYDVNLNPGGLQEICRGEDITLGVAGTWSTYRWSNGGAGSTITVSQAGKYWADVTHSSIGCTMRTDTVEVRYYDEDYYITGPATVCNKSGSIYKLPDDPNVSYTWEVEGGTIQAGQGWYQISVLWDDGNGEVRVAFHDNTTGCTSYDTLDVFVMTKAPDVTVSSGPVLCDGNEITLSVPEVHGTYTWSNGRLQREIVTNEPGAYWCRIRLGGCVFHTDTVMVIALDESSVKVSGPSELCAGSSASYTTTQLNGAQYAWSIQGGSIIAGDGAPQVEVEWGNTVNGSLQVAVSAGDCSVEDTVQVQVHLRPTPVVTGNDTLLCEGDTATLHVTEAFAGYTWSNGASEQRIEVTTTGDYSVTVTDAYGCKAQSVPVHVEVFPYPAKPVIGRNGNLLTCSVTGTTYQWYKDGTPMQGETQRTLALQGDGSYTVRVENGQGCAVVSDPFAIVSVGAYAPVFARTFSIAPNPNNGAFSVDIEFVRPTAFTVTVVNALGQSVYEYRETQAQTSYRGDVRLTGDAPGVYFLILESGKAYDFRKVIVH